MLTRALSVNVILAILQHAFLALQQLFHLSNGSFRVSNPFSD